MTNEPWGGEAHLKPNCYMNQTNVWYIHGNLGKTMNYHASLMIIKVASDEPLEFNEYLKLSFITLSIT
jgi:hypothetical protein